MQAANVLFRPLGVANGGSGLGKADAVIFGSMLTTADDDDELQTRNCCVRVSKVPRRAYLRIADGVSDADALAAVADMQKHLKLEHATPKITGFCSNAFGDLQTRGFGAVRSVRILTPRAQQAIPEDVASLGPRASACFSAVLASGCASAAEELVCGRRLCTWATSYALSATACGPSMGSCPQFSVASPKEIVASDDPQGHARVAYRVATVTFSRDGVLHAALWTFSFLAVRGDAPWAEPDAEHWRSPRLGGAITRGRNEDAVLSDVHTALEKFDPHVVVFATHDERRRVFDLADAAGIYRLGFLTGLPAAADDCRAHDPQQRPTRRGFCVLEDWAPDAAPVATDATRLAELFHGWNVLWAALCLARESRSLLFDALPNNVPRLADACMLGELRRRHIVAPDWRKRDFEYEGGFVVPAVVGLHTGPISLLDFKALYPSIVQERGICFTCRPSLQAKAEPNDPGEDEDRPLPRLMKRLTEARTAVQAAAADSPGAAVTLLAVALKLLANAVLGKFGAKHDARFGCFEVAEAITRAGRENLQEAVTAATAGGLCVVGGDTDSVFVRGPDEAVKTFVDLTNAKFRHMRIRREGQATDMLVVSKKRYAYVDAETGELRIKGLEMVKGDYPPITKLCCGAVLEALLRAKATPEQALAMAVAEFERARGDTAMWAHQLWYREGSGAADEAVAAARAAGAHIASGDRIRVLYAKTVSTSQTLVVYDGPGPAVSPDLTYCTRRFVAAPLSRMLAAASGRTDSEFDHRVALAFGLAVPRPPTITAARPPQLPWSTGDAAMLAASDPYDLAVERVAPVVRVTCDICNLAQDVRATAELLKFGTVCPECIVIVDVAAAAAALLADPATKPSTARALRRMLETTATDVVMQDADQVQVSLPPM